MRHAMERFAVFLAIVCAGTVALPGCGSQPNAPQKRVSTSGPKPAELKSTEIRAVESKAVETQSVDTKTAAPRKAVQATPSAPSSRAPAAAKARPIAPAPRIAAGPGDAPSAKAARTVDRRPEPVPQPKAGGLAASGPSEPLVSSANRSPAPIQDKVQTGTAPTWDLMVPAGAKDYTVVTVFYGTDRKPRAASDARRQGYAAWFYATAVCAAVTILIAAGALRWRQSRWLRALNWSGMTMTVLLGILATVARFQDEAVNPDNHIGYGNDRGEMQYGTCEVSIPKYHEVGEVERPSILRLDFKEDPSKHVVLLDVKREQPEAFFASLKARVASSRSREAMVFVHGYNVTFEDAARRTAQLAYDLRFDGPPIFFSWPSQGGLLQYAVDETNVAWSTPHLKDFLAAVARQSGAKSVHLIAHSMGNRALTAALVALANEMKDSGPMFREVVLTAPDIDADVFKRDIAPFITRTAQRVTLYASSNDEALALSKRLHGYPRAGDSGAQLVVMEGLDTIDVSNVDTSLLGHSYYGSNDTVLADLFYVLTEPRPARERRWLTPVQLGRLTYWVFQRAAANLREAASQDKAVR